jgi:hypothetical protein
VPIKPLSWGSDKMNRIVSTIARATRWRPNSHLGVYDRNTHGIYDRRRQRIVPKGSSVYDPTVFGKYDLKTQQVVPQDPTQHTPYNLDTMVQYAQRHRLSGGSSLPDDRIRISAGYIPLGAGQLIDACTPHANEFTQTVAIRNGYHYTPIDINGDGKSVLKEDLRSLSFDDESVSLIFSVDTLEHIKELDTALAEMHRVLATHGMLIAHVPCYFFARPDSPDIDDKNDPYGHVRYFSAPDLVNRLFERGFIPLRIGLHLDYGAAVVCAAKNPPLWGGQPPSL